jgi:hypothetical protein
MAKEIIKEIKGIPDYYISNEGIVYSTKISPRYNPKGEMRVLRPRTHPSGYLYVGMFVGKGPNKIRLWRRVHRIVGQTFIGKIPKGKEVNHKDMDKHNNKLTNLEYVTRSENLLHWRNLTGRRAKTKNK